MPQAVDHHQGVPSPTRSLAVRVRIGGAFQRLVRPSHGVRVGASVRRSVPAFQAMLFRIRRSRSAPFKFKLSPRHGHAATCSESESINSREFKLVTVCVRRRAADGRTGLMAWATGMLVFKLNWMCLRLG